MSHVARAARSSRLATARAALATACATTATTCAVLATACAGAAPTAPESSDARAKLDAVGAERDSLLAVLDKVPADVRQRCELTDGDCMIHVSEERTRLLRGRTYAECEGEPDDRKRAHCEEAAAARSGKLEEAVQYIDYENFCTKRLLRCAEKLVASDAAARHVAEVDERRKALETTPAAAELRRALQLAGERLEFLRSTLPTSAAVCEELPAVADCLKRVGDQAAALDQAVSEQGEAYDAARAAELFSAWKRTEAGCYEPEFECIEAKLVEFGATPESAERLEENLALIERRMSLSARVPAALAQRCVLDGVTEHQDRIVTAFQQYVKRPITYFRVQLLRAFAALHTAQVACLEQAAKQ